MVQSIFFSWQSDTETRIGKAFLRSVLDEACANIVLDASIDEPLRDIKVDSDTQGVAGQPPIVDTIFKKIDKAAIFIADLTFIGKRPDERPIPNPNVLMECGWALKVLGYERIIYVMNAAFGEPTRTNLPFDLGHLRFPICYNLPENASPETKAKEKKALMATLQKAISASLATIPKTINPPPSEFPAVKAKGDPARFRALDEALGFCEGPWSGEAKEVFLSPGSAMWLRVIPKSIPKKKWTAEEFTVLSMGSTDCFRPLEAGSGWNPFRAEDGVGVYRAKTDKIESKTILTDSVAFLFETGEMWAIEVGWLESRKSIPQTSLEEIFTNGLSHYAQLLGKLGIEPPYKWEAGICGLKGKYLGYSPPPGKIWLGEHGPVCAADQIEASGEYDGRQSLTAALKSFFEKIFQKCGRTRPEYLPQ